MLSAFIGKNYLYKMNRFSTTNVNNIPPDLRLVQECASGLLYFLKS
jgi:hypothetical protein